MVALETPPVETGWKAPDFNLLGVDGEYYNLEKTKGPNGLVVMFICNHCPYVKAIVDRVIRDTAELKSHGVNSIAIMSNDVVAYPDDSFENMTKLAQEKNFSFPYVIDETQSIAKAYGAVCTPDFFGFNSKLELQYRGRLDESRREAASLSAKRELFEAMVEIAKTGTTTVKQFNSMGCNIKWAA
jgi:peroxiredoxin